MWNTIRCWMLFATPFEKGNRLVEQLYLQINHAVSSDGGEDCCALRSYEKGVFWCVADGCGGLGSRRYVSLGNHTGAYAASRLAARMFAAWTQDNGFPSSAEEAQLAAYNLCDALTENLARFARQNCQQEKSRIAGTMQRTLPTTFCAAACFEDRACFWWAGDSRGYVMDAQGLHQYTRDDVRARTDAFDALYLDLPLSNLLSADHAAVMHSRWIQVCQPCVILTATDGVYACLPTPMEMEMLLLDTLRNARSMADWNRRLQRQIAANAQDDATLAAVCLCESFEQLKAVLLSRREQLQSSMITPVRRKKGNVDFARQKWLLYREGYDRTEEDHA